jgi:hypothetical protein
MRQVMLIAVLVLGACSSTPQHANGPRGGTRDAATQAPPPDATPAEVYRLFDARRSMLGAEVDQAGSALEPLREAGRDEEFERGQAAFLESVDPDALTPFLPQTQVSERATMSPADRRIIHVMSIEASVRPAQVEVRGEKVAGEEALLDVRGYFETPMVGQPGWRSGTVKLVREATGWKVGEEVWGAPGSGEEDAPSGGLEVSGAVKVAAERAEVLAPRLAAYGGGWVFSLRAADSGYAVLFSNIPTPIEPGEYPLTDRPTIPGDADPATLAFPVSALLGSIGDGPGFDTTWDEEVTGILTVESIEAGKMSGRFEFTARGMSGEPVNVRGSFRGIDIPEPVGGNDG